jgi:hypothetical protein
MSNIKPTRAQMFNGLSKRPTYEDISQEINPDKTTVIYPDRDAKFLREDPRMTQLDGVGFFESMKDQEEATIREQRKETTMRQMAKDSGEGMAETKIKHGKKEPQRFDMTKDDDVPLETHEAELTEKEKYKNERTQVKKDKMKEHLQRNQAKKKIVEDAFMKQAEQNQKDDLALASEPVTGGASSSQGQPPPKQPKARVERSRSRDQEPKTPKSESDDTPKPKPKKEPKEKKIKVQKGIERKKRTQKNKERRKTRRDES